MRGQNFLPATASPADSEHSILICRGKLETDQHLYLAFLCYRDYFDRSDASLSGSFAPQGLFRPVSCISIWLFFTSGIISTGQLHLYLAFLLYRDYSASVSCISILLFCSTGIISTSQLHLYLAFLLHRDYFAPVGCISILLFRSTGIISAGQIEALLEFLIFFQLLHFYFSLLDVELPFSVCQEQPFWHH